MRIVDVAAFYSADGGGVRTYIDRKLTAGPAAGHDITVIAPGPTDRVEARGDGARIVYLRSPRFPLDRKYHYFRDAAALHEAIDAARPDLVEASSPWRSSRMVADWPGSAPRVLIMHSDPLSAYAYRWFGRVASRERIDRGFGWFWDHLLQLDLVCAGVVSASADLSRRLIEGGMRNVVTNPMGVADRAFSPAMRDEGLRRRLLERCSLPADATLLLGAGRHAPEKRWPMVVEAVTAAGVHAPVGLVLLGDGRERNRIARAAADNPHIHLAAPIRDRTELARVFASADALIHGCEAETFCMVAAEARAAGLPLIVPDVGGAADQARQSGGWLYAAGDAGAAADAIARFLAAPRDDVRAAAAAAAPHVRTMDAHFRDLFAYYETLVPPPAGRAPAAPARREPPLVAGVELGGTKVVVAVGRGPDALVAHQTIPTTTSAETLAAVERALALHADAIAAIGVASFGPVALAPGDPHWGWITTTTKPGWSMTVVAPRLARAFGVPVAFDTDVNGAAIGEARWGALADTGGGGLYLTVGTGIGGGLLVGGQPLHGLVHPEMGHIRLRRPAADASNGTCPFHGDCLEGLASGPAILARLGGATLSDVAPDDPRAAAVIDDLGQGLATLVLALSPPRVVVGGGVAKAPGFHRAVAGAMRRWLGDYLSVAAVAGDDFVVPPALGDRAGVAGAIAMAHDLLRVEA